MPVGRGMLDDLIANDKYWSDGKWNHFRLIFGDSLEGVAQRERSRKCTPSFFRFASLRWLRKQRNRYREKGHHGKSIGRRLVMKSRIVQISLIKFPSIFLLALVTKGSGWLMILSKQPLRTGLGLHCWSIKLNFWWSTNCFVGWPPNNTMIDPQEQTKFIIRHIVPDSKLLRWGFSPTFTTPRPSQKSSGYFICFACLN